MKRFRNVSAIVSLLAGFITAVVMFINKYDLLTFIWILAVVSRIICFICDRHITKEEEKAEEERLEKEKQEIEARIAESEKKNSEDSKEAV